MSIDLVQLRRAAGRLTIAEWIIWFGVGGYAAAKFAIVPSAPIGVLAFVLLSAGVAQFLGHRRAWELGIVAYGVTAVFALGLLIVKRTSWWNWVVFTGCLWALWDHLRDRARFEKLAATNADNGENGGDDEPGPKHSLVLWLREPMYLDESILGKIAARAFGLAFKEGAEAENFVVGKGNHYMLKAEEALFLIHHWDRNYFNDPGAAAGDLRELRRAEAVRSHRAWIAMDFMQPQDGMGEDRIHALIGRFLSELAASGAEVQAIFHPATGRIAPWEPEQREKLGSASPLAVFEESSLVPVIRVDSDAPAMVAAVTEARRRWPEFVAAFRTAADKDRFSVKAPVTEGGNTEFIWIGVKVIADGRIHGLLANEPVALGNLKLGDFVSVAEADINDWVFPDPSDPSRPLGLFTVRAVGDAR